jgi:hypothetical protein
MDIDNSLTNTKTVLTAHGRAAKSPFPAPCQTVALQRRPEENGRVTQPGRALHSTNNCSGVTFIPWFPSQTRRFIQRVSRDKLGI